MSELEQKTREGMALYIQPIGNAGAEILGVDLSKQISADDLIRIKDAFAEYGVIFFRDQSLSEAEHIKFAKNFGPININRFFARHRDFPEIAMVTKEPDQTSNIGGGWHTDHSYDQEPAMGSILVARDLPLEGGDTWFLSMYKAYEGLPPELKSRVKNLSAIHSAKHIFGSKDQLEMLKQTRGRIGNSQAADALTDVTHPVVISHPESNRPVLYVNPGFTVRIKDLAPNQSTKLLEELYLHVIKEENMTKFKWRQGSIAFWDNRASWHFAQNDYHGYRRVMHRITIEGCSLQSAF